MIRPRKAAPPRRFALGMVPPPKLNVAALPAGEIDKIRRLLAFMAERRALGAEWSVLDRESLIKSAATMRHELRNVARVLPDGAAGMLQIDTMRAICRQFAERVEPKDAKGLIPHQDFYQLVGALRALLGLQIVLLAEPYGLPIDPKLETILPPPPIEE